MQVQLYENDRSRFPSHTGIHTQPRAGDPAPAEAPRGVEPFEPKVPCSGPGRI